MDVIQYQVLIKKLLPLGPAWDDVSPLIDGAADHLSSAHNQIESLALEETDPRLTQELLPRYENICGLPDGCSIQDLQTIQERQQRLDAKINSAGGIHEQFYLSQLAALGYPDATITRYHNRVFRVGSRAGDHLYNADWRFVWEVNLPSASKIRPFSVGSVCGNSLRVWGDTAAQCVIEKLAPSHTIVLFKYPETTHA
ncbi:MAG: YmfQ family protein [Plesiomonas sp.]|uniref:YmfQ family protein n=1 Tax=Plesiomonas sp. TaxID=2486279 RepID=UPI003F4130D2